MIIERVIFSMQEAWKHRLALNKLPEVQTILSIDWQALYQSGIRVIVLDFDGVLAPDNDFKIHDDVYNVLKIIKTIFGSHCYILSNNPKTERQAFFAINFPEISFVVAKKKPYPDGLKEIIAREQCHPQEVILIDDRLLTGGLATILADTRCLIITKPYICFRQNRLREAAFMGLRFVERMLFR